MVVHSDLVIPTQLDQLTLRAEQDGQVFEQTYRLGNVSSQVSLPATLALTPGKSSASELHVTARGALDGQELVRREARLSWIRGQRLMLRLDLLGRCRNDLVRCNDDETCTERGCQSISVDARQLPPYRREAALGPLPDVGSATDGGIVHDASDAGLADAMPSDGALDDASSAICEGNWCWEHPLPQGASLHGVWSPDENRTFLAVGEGGLILHYDGERWSQQPSGARSTLNAIWGLSAENLHIVGNSGTFLQRGANGWQIQDIGATANLHALHGVATTTEGSPLFVVGDRGSVFRRRLGNWEEMLTPDQTPLRCVWARAADDVYAGGDSGTVLHYDGDAWRRLQLGETEDVRAIWGDDTTVYLGIGRRVVTLDPSLDGVTLVDTASSRINTIDGTPGGAIYAGANNGGVLSFGNQPWTAIVVGSSTLAISAGSAGFLSVGGHGVIARGTSANWRLLSGRLLPSHVYAVWGQPPNQLFAVGDTGKVLHHDGEGWNELPSVGGHNLRGLWVDDALGEIFAVSTQGAVHRFAGGRWLAEQMNGSDAPLHDIWGTHTGGLESIFAVGDNTILRRRGGQWVPDATQDAQPVTANLRAIHGSGDGSLIVAVGADGAIWQRGPNGWRPTTSGTSRQLKDVWVGSASDAVAVGTGAIVRLAGPQGWRVEASGATSQLQAVWGANPASVVALGANGVVLRRTRTGWAPEALAPAFNPLGLWGRGNRWVSVGLFGGIVASRQMRCSTIGAMNRASNTLYLDVDGSLSWSTANDQQQVLAATPQPTALAGDFDGDGFDEIALYNRGTFFIDSNGDGLWRPGFEGDLQRDQQLSFGAADDIPVVGDWDGGGTDKLGVYRAASGTFFVDNGDHTLDEAQDTRLTVRVVVSKATPLSGDWDGDGRDELALFDADSGRFFLDADRNGIDADDPTHAFGQVGDLPLTGDFNCDGRDEIGVYRQATGEFHLDQDGDFARGGADLRARFDPGAPIDQVVAGRW